MDPASYTRSVRPTFASASHGLSLQHGCSQPDQDERLRIHTQGMKQKTHTDGEGAPSKTERITFL